ncbi:DNA-binding MarR family transcriptional regulator [Paenibacillus sp. LBL]|uniref:hypothetical protein n=1 Tax=Paenibacillus sp. LBL TaxID=2940563 RepID=UPI0024764A85|nr:hypothetical protein [Paenibacillus sp. LBL]MDH6674409.1 DNA-binding MarR family transcriptional regulator [Paenibacillus sp. LBL]
MSNFVYRHFCKLFKAYQSFDSKSAMNDSVRLFLSTQGLLLPKLSREVLKLIARKSADGVIGVSWMKVQTIADLLEVSRKTVERSINALVSSGIIKKVYDAGLGGRRYLIVIEPYQDNHDDDASEVSLEVPSNVALETPEEMPVNPSVARDFQTSEKPHSSCNLVLAELTNNKDQRINNVETGIHDSKNLKFSEKGKQFIESLIPEFFKKAIGTSLDTDTLHELWDRSIICARECRAKFVIAEIVEFAWKTTFKLYKSGKMQGKSLIAFYYGVLRNHFREFESHLALNDPESYEEHFYKSNVRKKSIKPVYPGHKPFITKHARKIICNISEAHGITFEEASMLYYSSR